MLRAAIAEGTELGRKAEPLLRSGRLVPDEIMIGLIRDRLAEDDTRQGFVLDGFPRNTAQAEALDTTLEETEPLIEYYRTRGNLVGIPADRSVDEVFAEIQRALEQVAGR